MAKEESCISHVDTPKRYDSNSDFYNSNSEFLHGVVEGNNVGKKEERVIVVSYLVSKNNSEEGEDGFESKDCKEENAI